jgi:hypothetical protein
MVRAWRAARGCVLTKDRTPNLKHPTWVGRFNANPIIVRVRGAKLPELFSFFWYSLERNFV